MPSVGNSHTAHTPDSQQRQRKSIDERTALWHRRTGSKEAGFHYTTADGSRITDSDTLERIAALVLPPAWTIVRIARSANASLQAIGTDKSGRVQYLYHPNFVARQEKNKFKKIERFGEYLPAIRNRTATELRKTKLSHNPYTKERVLAIVVKLIDELYFRVGSEMSVRKYKTYGITTLMNRHVAILPKLPGGPPEIIEFHFVGKHHVKHERRIEHKPLALALSEIKALPGGRLFKYLGSDGRYHAITPTDVNRYIKSLSRRDFSAKDFRTWGGTLIAARTLAELGIAATARECKKKIVAAVKIVADRLGNTPSIARSSYIHPLVLKAFERGYTLAQFTKRSRSTKSGSPNTEETALLKFLRRLSGKL